jgi:hypothetical protein
MLLRCVAKHGPKNWSLIARSIPGRTGKSCRLRCGARSAGPAHQAYGTWAIGSCMAEPCRVPATARHGCRQAAAAALNDGPPVRNHAAVYRARLPPIAFQSWSLLPVPTHLFLRDLACPPAAEPPVLFGNPPADGLTS